MKNSKIINSLAEILPLIVFFISYKIYGLIFATAAIVVTTIICTALNYLYNKHISTINIIATVIIAVFGSITIFTNNTLFIKLKPTIIGLIFAGILLFGVARDRAYIKVVLGKSMNLPDKAWMTLSKRFALFFIFLAISNEVVWRSFSEDTWVWFKAFGIIILSTIFTSFQISFINKNIIVDKS